MFGTSRRTMLHAIVLLAMILPASGDKPGEAATKGDWLLMIQSVTRHGDRAAEHDHYITKDADSVFFRGPGELSTEGILHARTVGKAYREAYVKDIPFIDEKFRPKEVKFRASGTNRVLMTAGAFSSSLFKDQDMQIQAPIYTTIPYEADTLLGINYNCDLGWEDMKDLYGLNDTTNMGAQLLDQMRQREWTCVSPPAAQSDTVLSEFANSKTKDDLTKEQKACARTNGSEFMYDYVERLGGSGTNNSDSRMRLQRTIGNLANEIVDNFKEMVLCYGYSTTQCDPYSGMARFYAAHDVNIVALLNVFTQQLGARDFFKGHAIDFGCSVVIELWMSFGVPYVKWFIKNGADEKFHEFHFCDYLDAPTKVGRFCTLSSMEQAKNVYLTDAQPPCMKHIPSLTSL